MKKLLSAYHLLHVLLLVLAVVALPVVSHLVMRDWQRYQQAQTRFELANKIQQNRSGYSNDIKIFNQFAQEAAAFLDTSRQYHIGEGYWEPYEVKVKDRLMGYGELESVLNNAKHGGNYYYAPAKIEVETDLLNANLPKALADRFKKEKVELGSKALVTVEGAYYVFRR
ncbi:MAG: hypothetical protein G8345_18750 [Magnetococcales bacterium]|nr:hypothetical protein [Magnetococcales bacterium]